MTTFIVPGPPVQWKRAGRVGRRSFTLPAQAAHKQKIAMAARKAGVKCIPQPHGVEVICTFFLPRPKKSGMYPTRRPDGDNFLKAVLDALNGIAWSDDSQVITMIAHKRYDDEEDPASTVITINRIDA